MVCIVLALRSNPALAGLRSSGDAGNRTQVQSIFPDGSTAIACFSPR